MSVRLILVRHGQTTWNAEGRYQGHTDTALAAAGIAEARSLASRLRGAGVSVVLSSPLQRARATAGVIARLVGPVPCRVDERLLEIGFGEWEGLTQAEVKSRWPSLLRDWKRAPESVRFPGGECLLDVWRRLRDFLHNPPWSGGSAPRCVVAVSHAGPVRLAKLLAEGRPLADFRQVRIDAGTMHEFDWNSAGRLRHAQEPVCLSEAQRMVLLVVTDARMAAARGDLRALLGENPCAVLHTLAHAFQSIGATQIVRHLVECAGRCTIAPAGRPGLGDLAGLEESIRRADEQISTLMRVFSGAQLDQSSQDSK